MGFTFPETSYGTLLSSGWNRIVNSKTSLPFQQAFDRRLIIKPKETVVLIILVLLAACVYRPSSTPTITPIRIPNQPMPQRPIIGGQISGLPENSLATINVRLPTGESDVDGERGNGHWEFVVTDTGGAQKIVTVEADGYVSVPISYTIQLGDEKAFIVENGQVTDKEAIHLDFQFKPK
jgi:hypothetical protein